MINLRIHTEFHFDYSDRGYGRLPRVVARIKELGQGAAAITDSTTFGHCSWFKECVKTGIKPLLGATIRVPLNDNSAKMTLIARNNAGLEELYGLTSAAASDAIDLEQVLRSSADVIKLTGMVHGLTKAQRKLLKAT